MALQKKAVSAGPPPINLFSDETYAGGSSFTLAEGDYILTDFSVVMFQPKDKDGNIKPNTPVKLGVMITSVPLDDPHTETHHEGFYSMGSKAHLSFAPNPDTGKGLVAIPGGPASTLQTNTNWDVFRKHLVDCDPTIASLPSNDLSVLDGMHVHMMPVPEPDERKGFRNTAATGEAAAEQAAKPQYDNKIAVVTEIKDNGKPWEGTGGLPAKAAGNSNGKLATAKVAPKPAAVVKKAAPVVEETGAVEIDDTVSNAAERGFTVVLEKNPSGLATAKLRTETFKTLKASDSEDVATSVINDVMENKDALEAILGQLGYTLGGVNGSMVKPVQ